ncbi:MAG TPA: TolC family protein [Bacteroidales bacterium]|nr:TolC family protein [Bacteroidales bacterium]
MAAVSCKVIEKPVLSANNDLYRNLEISDSANMAEVPWREIFTDPYLQSIIDTALAGNPGVRIAIARIKKAEAAYRQSGAEFFPSLNAGANASFQSETGGFGIPESYQVFGSTSWEADIWGKFRNSRRAALANLMASEAFRRAVVTDLVSSVAMNYYTLLALDAQLAITEQTLGRRIRNVEVMELLKQNDVITGADLVLSQANRYSAEVTIPDLKQRIYETENNLRLLMGESPGEIQRSTLDEQDLAPELQTGVPVQLLSNRPDVLEAEYRLRSSYEMARVARSNFYPSLTLNGRGGLTETSIEALFSSPVIFWNITAGLLQPIFNFGLNRQRFATAKADIEESQAAFRRTLLNAGSEVVNAMHGYQSATDKIGIRQNQIGYLEKAVEYTTELLKYTSNTSYIDVLTSEVNLLSAQLAGVNDRLQQLQSIVELYRSLGGGWR